MSSVGRVFGEFRLGERFGSTVAITPAHLVEGARLIGDFNPLHVDVAFAARSRYGAPILHGVITSALMAAPFGMAVSGTAIAYLEHDARFLAPVQAGDTLSIEWTVTELTPGRSFTWATSSPGVRLSAEHILTERDGKVDALLTFTMSGPLAPVASLLAGRMVRRFVDTEATSLKKWCEEHR